MNTACMALPVSPQLSQPIFWPLHRYFDRLDCADFLFAGLITDLPLSTSSS
ncbi:MAG TPA: hypothetical protein VK572_05340 [Burkholderiales bacterium]|nr:hypothetical protein [Burkholderiales bacterium]